MTPKGPIPDSCWLIDGKLLAGETILSAAGRTPAERRHC
jgi:hypothetical protein